MFDVLTANKSAANDGAMLEKITRELLVMACWCRSWKDIGVDGCRASGGCEKSRQSSEPMKKRKVAGSKLSIVSWSSKGMYPSDVGQRESKIGGSRTDTPPRHGVLHQAAVLIMSAACSSNLVHLHLHTSTSPQPYFLTSLAGCLPCAQTVEHVQALIDGPLV